MRHQFRSLHPRFARHTLRVPAQIVRMRDFRLVADRIENISLGGLLVGPSDEIELAEPVFVSFRLPDSDVWIDVDATVSRIIHGRRPSDRGRSFGLFFRGLTTDQILALRHQLEHTPPAPPVPRLGRRSAYSKIRDLAMQSSWTRSRSGHALVRWFER